jgi:hypothetical protein
LLCGNYIYNSTALYGSGRCKKCYSKFSIGKNNPNYGNGKKISGKRNPAYKSGKYIGNKNCLICKKKISNKATYCKKHGQLNNIQRRVPHVHVIGKYKNIFMRSSWELNFAKWLEISGYQWKYEPKTFNLENTTYTPDFYLPEFDCYIEIKGYWWKDAKQKFKLFLKHFPNINIKIFNREILQLMSIL